MSIRLIALIGFLLAIVPLSLVGSTWSAESQTVTCHTVTVDGVPYVCVTSTPTSTPTPTPTPTSTPTPTPTPGTATLSPVADATTALATPDTNFGTTTTLISDASPLQIPYLKFDLTSLAGFTVTNARLRMTVTNVSTGVQSIHDVSNTTWSESIITYNNRPSIEGVVATFTPSTATTIDVGLIGWTTSHIGMLGALAIDSPSTDGYTFTSKEGTTGGVQLIVDYTTGSPPTGFVVAAVGDIFPMSSSNSDAVGTGVAASTASIILGLGDYQYDNGDMTLFNAFWNQSPWGPNTNKLYPVLAPTHDKFWEAGSVIDYFNGGGASGYATPVVLAPHTPYSFNAGGWHFMAIDDACYRSETVCDTAALLAWVNADLAANPTGCTIAYWHQPYFTSSTDRHGQYNAILPVVTALYNGGVDVVLTGHQHAYERFAPQNPSRIADPNGLTAFVVGTGGIGGDTYIDTAPNSVVKNGATFGVLKLTLRTTDYDWQFVNTSGEVFTDSGTGVCH